MAAPDAARASVTSLRSPERTPLLFTTNMGLEDVVIDEYRERATAAGIAVPTADDAPFDLRSYARIEVEAPPELALDLARKMKSVHHVLAPLYTFALPDDDEAALRTIRTTVETLDVAPMETAGTFRVTTVRRGEHDFTSIDVQREAGAGLEAHYGTTVDLEEYDVEVRVDVHDDRCLVSVQHTREALSRRQARLFQPRAALKPNVAYALLRLSHLDDGASEAGPPDRVLDPFCGSGTILWEAGALWPDALLVGNDWNEETMAGARENAEAQEMTDRVTLHNRDVWYLAETMGDRQADLIVTNPPFGVRLASSMDFRPFYRRVLQQFHEVLRPGGRVVMLVLRQAPFNKALRDTECFDVRHVRVLEIGGLYPRVFVLGR
ncbi:SAM-dependent methyltransferase [Salinibacter sp. 10B]|uniref:THUMP domain-containing protein n=1 Tax=Salinibacter sp. 10B TaxID=1923971 RepID=UPI000CF40F73|nr:THUMP domain-containing protein [Salinibacter sp. 10B]PQJ34527.1 SAM-dependent methyltransferase [Salinibacter sp. 10B]